MSKLVVTTFWQRLNFLAFIYFIYLEAVPEIKLILKKLPSLLAETKYP